MFNIRVAAHLSRKKRKIARLIKRSLTILELKSSILKGHSLLIRRFRVQIRTAMTT